ncbi:protein kinase [Aureobasidium sp. EXF-12298]|nr:protein kinase [Aureobasidium sp. EXF-12298]
MFRQHIKLIRARIVQGPEYRYTKSRWISKRPLDRRLFSDTNKARTLQDDDFPRLPEERKFEEERYSDYEPHRYYPVHLGQTFASRHRVVTKLGYGTTSTVWLARDLELSLCTLGHDESNELAISHHIKSVEDGIHPGKRRLRVSSDDFQVRGPHGLHQCLVFPALGRTLAQLRKVFDNQRLDKLILQKCLYSIIHGLDFLHQTGVVHTDISPNNILVEASADVIAKVEEEEKANPSPRKVLEDRVIHLSCFMPTSWKDPVITDFGAAYLGEPDQKYRGDIMPGVYRAPEVIAGMEWSAKVDIWAMGVMIWDLFEDGNLFPAYKDDHLDDETHFAQMVALMGPPPREFLDRMSDTMRARYWDSDGDELSCAWIAKTPIPSQTLESREIRLHGKDQELLLILMRKILCWLPEDRLSAEDLYNDDFICQYVEYVMGLAKSIQET